MNTELYARIVQYKIPAYALTRADATLERVLSPNSNIELADLDRDSLYGLLHEIQYSLSRSVLLGTLIIEFLEESR